jgi:flagellar protein FlbD
VTAERRWRRAKGTRRYRMIRITKLDDREMIVNADLIKYVERTPDTIVTLTTGDKIIVRESPEEVVGRVIEYERKLRIFPRSC